MNFLMSKSCRAQLRVTTGVWDLLHLFTSFTTPLKKKKKKKKKNYSKKAVFYCNIIINCNGSIPPQTPWIYMIVYFHCILFIYCILFIVYFQDSHCLACSSMMPLESTAGGGRPVQYSVMHNSQAWRRGLRLSAICPHLRESS